ncbi:MAG: hypothetical protein ACLQB1_11910 [Streptosporangiaceae bacterium]
MVVLAAGGAGRRWKLRRDDSDQQGGAEDQCGVYRADFGDEAMGHLVADAHSEEAEEKQLRK